MCRLRTDGLAPMSKYWTYRSHSGVMGPISLVACYQQKLGFSPHFFIGCSEREAGYEPADRSAGALWVWSGVLLLRSSGFVQICWRLRERLLCVDHMRYVWSGTIRGLSFMVMLTGKSCWVLVAQALHWCCFAGVFSLSLSLFLSLSLSLSAWAIFEAGTSKARCHSCSMSERFRKIFLLFIFRSSSVIKFET
jgi:hypothetical protein